MGNTVKHVVHMVPLIIVIFLLFVPEIRMIVPKVKKRNLLAMQVVAVKS